MDNFDKCAAGFCVFMCVLVILAAIGMNTAIEESGGIRGMVVSVGKEVKDIVEEIAED